MRQATFHTVYRLKDGQRVQIPALKGKDASSEIPMETVADFTLESDVTDIVVNIPAVTDLVMIVTIPTQSVNNNGVESNVYYNDEKNRTFKMSTAFATSYPTVNVFTLSASHGLFYADFATSLNSVTNRLAVADRYPVNCGIKQVEPITKLRYRAGGNTFPAGTTVTIKGVKA